MPGVAVFTSQIDESVIDALARQRVASVYLDLGRVGPGVSNVVIDYEKGIAEALEYLVRLGHRRISYIGGPPNLLSIRRRKEAFIKSAARFGLEVASLVDSDFTVKGAYQASAKILETDRPTAIMAGNDLTAIGILHRAYDSRLRAPEDLSVIGFDDISFAEYTQPALTTVAVPRQEIGRLGFETLWAMMSDGEFQGEKWAFPRA